MNYRFVSRLLGVFCWWVGFWMLLPAGWAVWFGERGALGAIAASIGTCLLAGGVLLYWGRRANRRMYEREATALVGLGWLLVAALGALPFVYCGVLGPVDAYFESISGFTTTGSSVIAIIEPVPKSILFWRSLTHWLGGIGIVILMVAIIPFLGESGKMLYRSEATGLDKNGLRPRIRETTATLFKIYLFLTVIHTAFLMAAGMDLFDALCHTFGSLATGGYSTRTASIAAFDSVAVESVITVFELVGATNFTLFYLMARGDWRVLYRDSEWRVFMAIFAVTTVLVVFNLLGAQGSLPADTSQPGAMGSAAFTPAQALRHASFEVGTMMTNTGFASTDFNVWPYFSRILIMMVVITGGCSGSTAGGLKIIRVIILFKIAVLQIQRTFRPHTIRAIRVNNRVVPESVQYGVLTFFFIYISFMAFSTVVMSLLGLPLPTAFSAVVACQNNTGPGLDLVGAVENFAFISIPGKCYLCLVMIIGRLEFFSILVFIFPSFWHRS